MVEFQLPTVYTSPDGWGPPSEGETLDEILGPDVFNFAFEHLDKYPLSTVQRSKICDFTAAGLKYQEQRMAKGKAKGKGKFQNLAPSKPDEEGFALVDTRQLPNKTYSRGRGFGFGRGKGRGKGLQVNYQEGILGQNKKPPPVQYTKGRGKKGGPTRRGVPSLKEWSVNTKTEWPLKKEVTFTELSKLQLDAREVKTEDVMWCGELPVYDRNFDRITLQKTQLLKRFENLNFFNVTTTDDPTFGEIMPEHPDVTVYSTDQCLACLVAAGRSVYSWDLVISKVDGKIIIDKRNCDFSQVDMLSVNETATEPPGNDDKESPNSAVKLSQEASCINQNFTQMLLDYQVDSETMENPNPFEEEGELSAASCAYRYRKFTLPGNAKASSEFEQTPLKLVVRTEINCKMPGPEGDPANATLMKTCALNEYDPKVTYSWRKKLEQSRGEILATELKNNSFKIGRWTAQAILSGASMIKLGYVSRRDPKDPWVHDVLAVHTQHTDKFAEQIGMHQNNLFGIIRQVVNMVMAWDDGKYLLIKDPLKPFLRIYEVPWDTFQEEDDEDGEEEEEDEGDIDEDGNVAPSQPVGPTA